MADINMETAEQLNEPFIRPSKRQKFYRKRTESEEDDSDTPLIIPPKQTEVSNHTMINELIAQHGTTSPNLRPQSCKPAVSIVDLVHRPKAARAKKGGIEFRNSMALLPTPQASTPVVENVEEEDDDIPAEIRSVISRFAPQTGHVSEETDKHMPTFPNNSSKKQSSAHAALTNTDRQRQPATLGKLHEIDLGPDATLRNIARTEAAISGDSLRRTQEPQKPPKPRIGRNGKLYIPRPRRRRSSTDIARDKIVEEVLRETKLEMYDDEDQEDDDGAGAEAAADDQAADDRIAEQFRREFLEAISQRRQRARHKHSNRGGASGAGGKGKVADGKSRGPKLGGSRSARAAMRERQEAASKAAGAAKRRREHLEGPTIMDPFSIAAGVVGVAGVLAHVIKNIKVYIHDARNADGMAATMLAELASLHSALLRLNEFLRGESVRGTSLAFGDDAVLVTTISACKTKVDTLSSILAQREQTSRFKRSLRWPLDKSEHEDALGDIKTFTQWIQLALTIDGSALLSRTSDEVAKVLAQQLQSLSILQSVNKRTGALERRLDEQMSHHSTDRDSERRKEILRWLSTYDHEGKHESVKMPRVTGTGRWLLVCSAYAEWRENKGKGRSILARGLQGAGKSVLSSFVIDDLRGAFDRQPVTVAFAYLSHVDRNLLTAADVVASMVKQIAQSIPDAHLALDKAFKNSKKQSSKPRLEDLEKMMAALCQALPRVFMVLDALDEFDSIQRKLLLGSLSRFTNALGVHLFITCRTHLDLSTKHVNRCTHIEIRANEHDIKLYLSQAIDESEMEDVVTDDFRAEILARVAASADGMFLLAVLQIRRILTEPTVGEMEDALDTMPTGLHDAFDDTLRRIQSLPESRRRLGMATLMWLSHAKTGWLTVGELREALAIPLSQRSMDQRYCPSQKTILECCMGLIRMDTDTGIVYFMHSTVQEYLRKDTQLFTSSNVDIAEMCLKYLTMDGFTGGPFGSSDDIEAFLEKHTFMKYAANWWGHHVRDAGSLEINRLATNYLSTPSYRHKALQIRYFTRGYREYYWAPEEVESKSALHIACIFELEDAARSLLDNGANVNAVTSIVGSTPLIVAAATESVAITRLLLERSDIDLGKPNWYGTALHCAAEAGQCGSIGLLLEAGMPVNVLETSFGRTALHCAVDMGHWSTVNTLRKLGADINIGDYQGRTPLHYAARSNTDMTPKTLAIMTETLAMTKTPAKFDTAQRKTIMRKVQYECFTDRTEEGLNGRNDLLLDRHGVLDERDRQGNTPLHNAATMADGDMCAILLGRGADPTLPNHAGLLPWELVEEEGHVKRMLYRSAVLLWP
ncbi:MAG: hypothetical protein Q9163_001041 [Psora crenata]